MKIIGVIPARYASTRFPGKPLVHLIGKPLLQWVVEGAKRCTILETIIVATDDDRIEKLCKDIGVEVVRTSPDCATGTDRLFEATKNLDFDVVLNIQGDEPLVGPEYINPLAEAFLNQNGLDMATLAHPASESDIQNPNAVKVIINRNSEAIYFSRFAIPYSREAYTVESQAALKHVGLYAYTKSFLQTFCTSPQAEIEKAESLEQLRALYLGARIKVIQVEKPTYGVDTPEDLRTLEALLK